MDELLSKACAAYNFFPNQHSWESLFFLLQGRDPLMPLNQLLGVKRCYLGDESGLISLEDLQKCFALAATNIRMARDANPDLLASAPLGELHVGDPVLLKNHERGPFQPRYLSQFWIVSFKSDQQVELVSPDGRKCTANIQDIVYQYPAMEVIHTLPEAEAFGRAAKFMYHPDNIPNLHWSLTN